MGSAGPTGGSREDSGERLQACSLSLLRHKPQTTGRPVQADGLWQSVLLSLAPQPTTSPDPFHKPRLGSDETHPTSQGNHLPILGLPAIPGGSHVVTSMGVTSSWSDALRGDLAAQDRAGSLQVCDVRGWAASPAGVGVGVEAGSRGKGRLAFSLQIVGPNFQAQVT